MRHDEFSRRRFLAGLAAMGGVAALPAGVLNAQGRGGRGAAPEAAAAPAGPPFRIDTHAHFASPRWIEKNVASKRAGFQALMNWTPAKAIEDMDKAQIKTAVLSSTQPGVTWGDNFEAERAESIAIARDMNEYGAKLVSDSKGRFGLFALLPLPDIDASLKEIEYALDTLKADGFGLMTNYQQRYIGEAIFDPILQELNRRKAVVYSHPTDGPCCHSIGGQAPGTVEWFTDTTRAILSVIAEGAGPPASRAPSAATKYPDITYIWSHGGGSMIGLALRVVGNVSADDLAKPPMPNSRMYNVRRMYYDTAFASNPVMMAALPKLLGGTSQIVFGTDYPFGGNIQTTIDGLKTSGLSEQDLKGIDRENVVKILPKYKA